MQPHEVYAVSVGYVGTGALSAGGGAFEVHGDGCAICFGGGGDNGSAGDLSDEFEEMTALEILMGKVSKLTSL